MTDISICNLALTQLSTARIASLDESTENGRKCKAIYELSRDSLLADHNWNFARAEKELALIDETPVSEDWAYIFQLPSDCLRVMRMEEDEKFAIFSDRLYTNSDVAKIEYIKRETNPVKYSPMFVKALAGRIAADLAYGITQNATVAQLAEQRANQSLREAKWTDAQEGINTLPIQGNFIRSRQ
jgi:hypothetical protein